jgi:SRSO17 transposase
MLPEIRHDEGIYPVPQFAVERIDIEGFIDELRGFHSTFHDCFARSEPRENFFRYMVGQLSPLERKSIEPIALHVQGGKPRRMQSAIADSPWDEELMLLRYHRLVNEDMGDPEGVLLIDESGVHKKGEETAGVARQYCGSVGKVENCQVGVFAGYASRHGYALLDKRLFVPEQWFDEAHEERRNKVNLPDELTFKTKPQLAAAMLEGLLGEGIIPFRYVAADSAYGESEDFLRAVESHVGLIYFVEIGSDTLCWPGEGPARETRTYHYRGETRSRRIVPKGEKPLLRVDRLAESIHEVFWYKRTVCEGTKGPIDYEFARRRVTLSRDGVPTRTVWLALKRSLDRKRYWFFISNAPLSTRLNSFVWLSGIRWAIEQIFEEAKTELGMDHSEVRKFTAWNHHILTCMLAHFFLWHIRIRLGKKSTAHYALAAQDFAQDCAAHETL